MKPKEQDIFRKIRLLGQGAYGKAYQCEYIKDKTVCVIKQIDLNFMSQEERQEAFKEARIMEQLKHPNIVNFREVYKTIKGKLCIVMDYADGGDLALVLQNQDTPIPESKILDWFTQMCLAVKHCHDRKIVHRDLKTKNLFLTKDQRIKLGDFGIAKLLNHTRDKLNTMVGTPYYLAPELIENKPYSFKSDIWSLGIVLFEMCCRTQPFQGESLPQLALKIVRGQYPSIPTTYSRDMRALVNQLLTVNPDRRPTVHQILKLPLITNRIKNFLSETVKRNEFDHTIMHNQQIQLTDTTIPLMDDEDYRTNRVETRHIDETPRNQHKHQLPGIKSPKQVGHRSKANFQQVDPKKLPEIKVKLDRPPVTRQQSSRGKLSSRIQPSTPDVQKRSLFNDMPPPTREGVIVRKNIDSRFITKESPDSLQGSDNILEDNNIQNRYPEGHSPKWFSGNQQKPKRNSDRLVKIDQQQLQQKVQMKSDDDGKVKLQSQQVKYRLHVQQKFILEQVIKTKIDKSRKVSADFLDNEAPQQMQQPIELHRISETPENKNFDNSEHLDQTTISNFQLSEEQQQIPRVMHVVNEFNGLEEQSRKQVFEITKKKDLKQNKQGSVDTVKTDESKRKFYKIIYKDPFMKIVHKKLKNSEEDLREMLSELKNIVEPTTNRANYQSECLREDNQQEEEYIDDSGSADEQHSKQSKHSNFRSGTKEQQVNTWMHGYSREESQVTPIQPKESKQDTHGLRGQLHQKLGHYFDGLYRLAKLSSHLEDFGKQNVKMNIMDIIDNVDEQTADGLATLLITLVIQSQGSLL